MTNASESTSPFLARRYNVNISHEDVNDLRRRLARIRWPDQLADVGWDYGAPIEAVKRLCTYWRDEFSFDLFQQKLNEWPQYTTNIDGENIHFVHIRSPHEGAFPLMMTHGWPGSIAEFQKVAAPLVDPVSFGGRAEDAFHLVLPSIPGYGFSGPTTQRGWDVARVAQAFGALMEGLGYAANGYGVQGGDWGSIISAHTAVQFPDAVKGCHLNMVVARPPAENPMDGVLPEEMAGLGAMQEFRTHEVAYQEIQKTRPQTLAYGLTDSPAGLAGWILEKFRQWSDCDGDPFKAFTFDELCTNISIYWFTGTINSSTRLYYETIGPGRQTPLPRVEVPTACALFAKELYLPPRVWADRQYNVQQWNRFDRGGHFAALEQPQLLVNDIRTFFATIR
jgi:pimeloyl-ACP methyl ester carboxylesterase